MLPDTPQKNSTPCKMSEDNINIEPFGASFDAWLTVELKVASTLSPAQRSPPHFLKSEFNKFKNEIGRNREAANDACMPTAAVLHYGPNLYHLDSGVQHLLAAGS
jgi:hypothetical protein